MTSDSQSRLPLKALRWRIRTTHEMWIVGFHSPFSHATVRRIIPPFMAPRNSVPDTFTLSGDDEQRLTQLLELARHQARAAQTAAAPRMQDALTDIEDTLADHLVARQCAGRRQSRCGGFGRSWSVLAAAESCLMAVAAPFGAATSGSPSCRALWPSTTRDTTGRVSGSISSIPRPATASA